MQEFRQLLKVMYSNNQVKDLQKTSTFTAATYVIQKTHNQEFMLHISDKSTYMSDFDKTAS